MQVNNLAGSGGRWQCECLPFVCLWLPPELLRYSLGEIRFIDDVVAIEHRSRLPATKYANLRGDCTTRGTSGQPVFQVFRDYGRSDLGLLKISHETICRYI
jgi:hypothetical protein